MHILNRGFSKMARAAIVVLATIGLGGIAPIAYQQLSGERACPALGPVPACYVVLLGYGLIATSALLAWRFRPLVFLAGWGPLFLLALIGSSLELFGQQVCPRSSAGIPACFLSFLLLGLLAVIYLAERRHHSRRIAGRDRT